jgi:cellulose synthase/poly-beta-1,6-N-acetylglucosamine synthase-like glycosyltransferase
MISFLLSIICQLALVYFIFLYAGFPLGLYLLTRLRGKQAPGATATFTHPMVQVVVPIFNELDNLPQLIANIREQHYHHISILFISDGSTDGSVDYILQEEEKTSDIDLYVIEKNAGKNPALNAAFQAGRFQGDLVCFTDADTLLAPEAIASAVQYFSNPQVGLVGGRIFYWLQGQSAHLAEGFYWRLENFLREAEGDLGCLVSCPGQFILMRQELFKPLPPDANTDFAMPLSVLAQGYQSRFDRAAVVWSAFPTEVEKVLKRRQRTIIRALTTMAIYRTRLPWFIRGVLFWHKTARFYAFPAQAALLLANLGVVYAAPSLVYVFMLLGQLLFYGAALAGWLSERLHLKLPYVHLPYEFTRQHLTAFAAVLAYHRGQRVSKWTPPR